ncbi:MAG: class I SAM-dependent methyltransferase [bacterium]
MVGLWLKRWHSPYEWSKTSQAFYQILVKFLDQGFSILEAGSSTGHISFRLARKGYRITLLDVREEPILQAARNFRRYGLTADLLVEDFFSHSRRYDLIWNSGLVQCFDDDGKVRLISHARRLADRLLLFYPDTDSGLKRTEGGKPDMVPGVEGSREYPVAAVPQIFYSLYNRVFSGRVEGAVIDMPFDMLWTYGEQ